jgi:hypothetical protein
VALTRSQQRTVRAKSDRLIVVVFRPVDDADAFHDALAAAGGETVAILGVQAKCA